MSKKAIFLDRDGVLNYPVVKNGLPYPPTSIEEFQLYDDVPGGCKILSHSGYLLVVTTNQPDVGRGSQTKETVEAFHQKLRKDIPEINHIEVCYHSGLPNEPKCNCRKPLPGMVLNAAQLLNIELSESFLVGDRWRDIDCGYEAGCSTIFIDRGYSENLRKKPDFRVTSFSEAVEQILQNSVQLTKSI